MYNYIIGKVVCIADKYIVLENNNIGYKIFVPRSNIMSVNKEYKIFLYNHIRQEEYSLYGFHSSKELDFFLKLLNIKGLGPKVGLSFLSIYSLEEIIIAINNEDITFLRNIPKVGDKLARQIILDLKGKLSTIDNKMYEEVTKVLVTLGYNMNSIKSIYNVINKEDAIEQQVKTALSHLSK